MKALALMICFKFFGSVSFEASFSWPALTDNDIATLSQEKTRLELETDIENQQLIFRAWTWKIHSSINNFCSLKTAYFHHQMELSKLCY